MNFDSVASNLFDIWREAVEAGRIPQTVCLLGAPGIGKTSACRELARMMTEYMRSRGADRDAVAEVRDLSSSLPEDLGGLPYRDGDTTRYAPPVMIRNIIDPDAYGVLVLDDLPAASTAVQVASRQISLEHRVHDHAISGKVMVIVTGNRREDKSAASTLPAHFRNSVLLLTVEPDLKTWEEWAHEKGADQLITSFLTFRPAHFSRTPADADQQGAFATPRTWMMLANVLSVARKNNALREMAAGLVGDGVAQELCAFELVRTQLVAPEKVLANPEQALPNRSILNSPDKMIAMVTGLADAAIHKAKTEKGTKAYVQFLKALAYVTETGGRDYVATSVATFISHKGNFGKLKEAVVESKSDPRVAGMLSALAACFK
jgi:MoxR-like ATPase